MSFNICRSNAISCFSLILIFIIITDLSIILNIPFIRQLLGFIFLSLIPGYLILCIIKPVKLGLLEIFILSAGLSISFIMFFGISINTIYPFFGYETPLCEISIVISFTIALLILAIITQFSGRFINISGRYCLKLDPNDKAFIIIPLLFPVLSIAGMYLMNTADNNIITIALLFLIPSYVIFISIQHNQVPEKVFPIIIFLTSISIILLWAMRSSHIMGTDVNLEYTLFRLTLLSEKWQIFQNSTVDSCLSISILPAAYQSFLKVNNEYLFKILYPLLFSISPLVIYLIAKNYVSNIYAFLASIFFMSQSFFIITTASPRTNIAILFFALSIMVLVNRQVCILNKRIILIIFIMSCTISHYSTTYVFFSVLIILFVLMQLSYKIIYNIKKNNTIAPLGLEFNITLGILGLFFIFLFFWYSQVTGAAFDKGIGFIAKTIDSMQGFLIEESRDTGISIALGSGLDEKPLLTKISFIICWLPNILIIISILATIINYSHRVALYCDDRNGSSDFLSRKLDLPFFFLGHICFIILVAMVALPYVSIGYDLGRINLQMMVVLSSFLIFGGLEIARFIKLNRYYLIILFVIIPYFIFSTGALHCILGVPNTVILASEGMSYDLLYIQEQDSYACRWLGENIGFESNINADAGSRRRLMSQGGIGLKSIKDLAPSLEGAQNIYGYIYLKYSNIINGKIIDGKNNKYIDLISYFSNFSKLNMIYNNGGSEVWRSS